MHTTLRSSGICAAHEKATSTAPLLSKGGWLCKPCIVVQCPQLIDCPIDMHKRTNNL